jgi:type I restriction enzyme M protein
MYKNSLLRRNKMLNFDVKRKINTLRDILVGKVPDPKAQVEQITIALIYKFMDDMDLEGLEFGGSREFFKEDYEKYAWTNIMQSENSGQQRLNLYAEGIEKMAINPHLPQLFRDIFRGAYVPYRDPETLNMFLKEINDFTYDHSEDLGNAFEYLLSIMGSQGDAGQFRTPRHIIDMIVEIVDPKKTDSILDPACGTAGFLISSYKHILEMNRDKDGNSTLSADERKRMTDNFAGYDISPDMVRLSRVNMYLHKFAKPQISEYDTLSSVEKWDESYDVILANPPFMTPKGGIIPHNRYRIHAKRAEVLFVDYIAEHLNPTGKAGIIVPEGIVFQSANAYKELRKYLVEDNLLYAVISLPAGVFNPYSGVKTSILLLDKTIAKQKDKILFVKLNNDGYDLGAQRRELSGSDIPEVIKIIKAYQNGVDVSENALVTMASKKEIAKQDYILVGERYKETVVENSDYPMVELDEIALEIRNGTNVTQIDECGKYRVTRIQTIADGTVDLDKTKWTNDEPAENYFMEDGDILLSHINSYEHLAKTAIFSEINEKVVHGINLIRFRLNRTIVNPKYAILCMKSDNFINHAKTFAQKAVNQASIKTSDLKQIKIPLPPLHIQEEIVKEIDGYQKIIDGAKQVIENYKPIIKIDPNLEVVKLGETEIEIIDGDRGAN